MTWIVPADLDSRFGAAEIDRIADLDGDGTRDSGVVEQRIGDAEDYIRARLLTAHDPDDLPTSAAAASAVLRSVAADLTWWELHKRNDVIPDSVKAVRDDARAMLESLVDGPVAALLAELPAAGDFIIITSESRPTCDRLTLRDGVLDW